MGKAYEQRVVVKVERGKDGGVNYKMLNDMLKGVFTRLPKMDLTPYFTLKFKDHEFNALPFLLNSSNWFNRRTRSAILGSITKQKFLYDSWHMDENIKFVEQFVDPNVYFSILPANNTLGIRECFLYQYMFDRPEFNRCLFEGAKDSFQEFVINGEAPYRDFKCKDFANTQAFSCYILLKFILKLEPRLNMYMMRQIKAINLDDLLSSFVPEGTPMYRFLMEEIDSAELFKLRTKDKFSDGSTLIERELFENISDNTYEGRDLLPYEVDIAHEWVDRNNTLKWCAYNLELQLGYCMLFNKDHLDLEKSVTNEQMRYQRTEAKLEDLQSKYKSVQAERNTLSSKVRELDAENSELKSQLKKIDSQDDLKTEIAELEESLESQIAYTSTISDENTALKKQIREQKKQIKSLMARLKESSESDVVSEVDSNDLESGSSDLSEVTFEDSVNFLRDKSIILVGGDFLSVDKYLQDLGIPNVKRFIYNLKGLGKCDAVVIFTQYCSHSSTYRAMRMMKGSLTRRIFFNGTNLENLVMTMYNELSDE